MPTSQAFVLMNLDLIAVPLQVSGASVVTIYCGKRRATQLLDERERMYAQSTRLFMSSQRAAPSESFSISGHFSAGTIPLLIHS